MKTVQNEATESEKNQTKLVIVENNNKASTLARNSLEPRESIHDIERRASSRASSREFHAHAFNINNNSNNGDETQIVPKRPLKRTETKLSFRDRLNPRLYFALILSGIYILCSACFIAAIFIDAFARATDYFPYMVFAMSRISMWFYTAACPVVMVRNLPPLRISATSFNPNAIATAMVEGVIALRR